MFKNNGVFVISHEGSGDPHFMSWKSGLLANHRDKTSLLTRSAVLRKVVVTTSGEHMPTISMFYGILIQMFWADHAPPHFHVLYSEYEAQVDIETLRVIKGELPKRALALVLEWASEHTAELMEDWELCAHLKRPKKISPLN